MMNGISVGRGLKLLASVAALALLSACQPSLRAEEPSLLKTVFEVFAPAKAKARPETPAQNAAASHQQSAVIQVNRAGGSSLQTMCLAADGRILALVAPPRSYGAPVKNATSDVQVYSPDGKQA